MSLSIRCMLGAAGAVLASVAALLPATCVAAAGAQGTSETGTTTVRAKLRFYDGQNSEVPVWTELRITIARNDVVIADNQPLPPAVSTSYFTAPRMLSLDLNDDDDPEVLVDVFTAGYSCCRRSAILRYDGAKYAPTIVEWSTDGYELLDVGGGESPEFLTDDGRFSRMFGTSGTRGPLRILRLVDGNLRDVTASIPARLRRDARVHARALRRARSQRVDTRPALAAYVVDLARLGQVGTARKAIATAAGKRELRTTRGGFARRIDARMIAWGYASKPLLSGVATPVSGSR